MTRRQRQYSQPLSRTGEPPRSEWLPKMYAALETIEDFPWHGTWVIPPHTEQFDDGSWGWTGTIAFDEEVA